MPVLYNINRLTAIHIFGLIECEPPKEAERVRPVYKAFTTGLAPEPIYIDASSWTLSSNSFGTSIGYALNCGHKPGTCFPKGRPPSYTASFILALDIMRNKGFRFYLLDEGNKAVAQFSNGEFQGWAEADTLGLAVLVAALHALKVPDLETHGGS
jgi:hypothetical protein